MGVALGCPRPCPSGVCTSALCQLGAGSAPWAAMGDLGRAQPHATRAVGTRRGVCAVPSGSWGAAISARGVRCAAPAWHGGGSSLQLRALCRSKAHFVHLPARR